MLMECEICPEMNPQATLVARWMAALAEQLLVVACCAKRNKFDIRAGRYLPLLQDARWRAGCHARRHRRLAILAAEEIAAHCEAHVALGIDEEFVRRYIIGLFVLRCRELQVAKILEHVERLLLGSGSRNK
jgi:hypothetical protein